MGYQKAYFLNWEYSLSPEICLAENVFYGAVFEGTLRKDQDCSAEKENTAYQSVFGYLVSSTIYIVLQKVVTPFLTLSYFSKTFAQFCANLSVVSCIHIKRRN